MKAIAGRLTWGAVCILAVLLLVPNAWGQATTSLRGTISDPSGAAIAGATLTLVNPATSVSRSATTDANGAYVFLEILPGTYALTVQANGFEKYVHSGLVLRVALPATLNVSMKVGSVNQEVSVTGEAPLLNTTNASLGQTMVSQQIENLPLEDRNVPALLSVQPGVVFTSNRSDLYAYDTRSGSVNGERSDQNTIKLDGVVVNDQFQNQPFTTILPVTPDSVQEFRVTTSNYGADEGRSAGAQVELATKGGTNNFHGSLYEYNRSGLGEANDYFIKNSEASTGEPNKPPHLVRNLFGGSVGGPIKKNRLFFFFNYEGHRYEQANSVVRTVPSATLRDGIIQYACDDPTQCPGSSVTGLSGKSYAVQPGNFALDSSQLQAMDPLGLGANPAALAYFNSYPMPNDFTVGDPPNFDGYRFAAPTSTHNNWMIGRIDYKITNNGNHNLFIRGSGEDDTIQGEPFLPTGSVLGGIPENAEKDLNKGFVVGYTAILGPNWVNNFRYGLTHQSVGIVGNTNDPWIVIRDLSQGVNRSHSFTVPLQSFGDDLSWTHGKHTIQFGGGASLIRRNSVSQEASFSDAVTNADYIDTAGIAGSGDSLDPSGTNWNGNANGYPVVADPHAYDFPLVGLIGMVTEGDATWNYHLNPNLTGTELPQGQPLVRHYSIDEYNLYLQDTWQMKSNLTLTYGLRWDLMGPIGETSGQEVSPTFPLGQWFNQRGQRMREGQPSSLDPLITFGPAGPSYSKPGYYSWQKKNFAPRVGIAWTPQPSADWLQNILGKGGKTVIRAGFSMDYDHFGPALALAFDANGAFGLTTQLSNFAGCETIESSPRFTSINTLPANDLGGSCLSGAPQPLLVPSPFGASPTYPVAFPTNGPAAFAITWGLDSGLKTPYSYAADFSIERQLPGNMAITISYVGHFAHRLLVQEDLATPYDLTDPQTHIDYFSAVKRFSQLARQGVDPATITAAQVGPTAQYWTDMMTPQASYPYCDNPDGLTSTPDLLSAMYDIFNCTLYNETTGLFNVDLFGFPTQPTNGLFSFYNQQYSSLYGWRSIGYSNYNALQVSLTKHISHGLIFDFNYTYSKSLDIGSDAESVGQGGIGAGFSTVINAWEPYQLYGPSDFDLRHQINADWVYALPFGRGQSFGSNVGKGVDALIGGWQLSGLARWSSGFPTNTSSGFQWSTDWELSGNGSFTGSPVATGRTNVPANNSCGVESGPNMFKDPCAAFAGFQPAFPGESGVRNAIRGDGFAGVDMGLTKTWHMPYNDAHTLEFRWDVFNVANLKRFDVASINNELDQGPSVFGTYTRLLTNPRIMQFALRYQF